MKITKLKEVKLKEEPLNIKERDYKGNPEREGLVEQDVEFFAESELCDINSLSQYIKHLNDRSIN